VSQYGLQIVSISQNIKAQMFINGNKKIKINKPKLMCERYLSRSKPNFVDLNLRQMQTSASGALFKTLNSKFFIEFLCECVKSMY
jgi:hypothetical protein